MLPEHIDRMSWQFQMTTTGTGITVILPTGNTFYGSIADLVLGIVERFQAVVCGGLEILFLILVNNIHGLCMTD